MRYHDFRRIPYKNQLHHQNTEDCMCSVVFSYVNILSYELQYLVYTHQRSMISWLRQAAAARNVHNRGCTGETGQKIFIRWS